ncbi:oxidoreductase [Magnaporthiopsis poae ATCC 64411]|uniref:Oxidoreductase n=1 Tax=Magnaporthiopsis poae (strain ATCC 64411 / 73-15) TaxID=644358 RepID=A0A0C4E3Z7_MAGP6|nr:oxidoreductase [Magnaporthiopsis poae ATCC 64411]
MTINLTDLDAHEQPSDRMRAIWKSYARAEPADIVASGDVDDDLASFILSAKLPAQTLTEGFRHLDPTAAPVADDSPVYHHPLLPGLLIFPSVVPPSLQRTLLDKLVHRDLSVPEHQTNLHLHYDLPYPEKGDNDDDDEKSASFFTYSPDSPTTPHGRVSSLISQGGFPPDVAAFLETVFPDTLAQAAIVNFYSPGDTMMMHRDVSEETDKGLVSISLGCDGLFMIAPSDLAREPETAASQQQQPQGGEREAANISPPPSKGSGSKDYLLLRLRSGDAIYMTNESRYAWHGVPKVLKGTCPPYLEDWPAGPVDDGEGARFEAWRGWMKTKRINLNVRQMRD